MKSPNPNKGVMSTAGVKPPVPSRNKVNEMLRSDERLGAGPGLLLLAAESPDD